MKRWLAVIFIVGLMAFFLACRPQLSSRDSPASRPIIPPGETAANPQVVTPTPTPTPTPPPPWYIAPPPPAHTPYIKGPTPYPPPKNEQEWLAQQEEIDRRSRATGGFVTRAGPETKGATLTIAGKKIKLPDDAYWDGIVGPVTCGAGIPCPQGPYIIIARGKSNIGVNINSGQITGETIAPGEEGTFAFLDKELPPQVTGPRTAGTTLRIAGRDVKLPSDTYVGDITSEKDMVSGRDCLPPPKTKYPSSPACIKLPLYGLVKGGSGIWISAVDGAVYSEEVWPLGAATFDSVKRQLQ